MIVFSCDRRELSLARMRDLDIPCKDIRTREVGMKQIQEAVSPDDVELIRRDYVANGGWETFLSYEDPEKDILIGRSLSYLPVWMCNLHCLIIYVEYRLIETAKSQSCCISS